MLGDSSPAFAHNQNWRWPSCGVSEAETVLREEEKGDALVMPQGKAPRVKWCGNVELPA